MWGNSDIKLVSQEAEVAAYLCSAASLNPFLINLFLWVRIMAQT